MIRIYLIGLLLVSIVSILGCSSVAEPIIVDPPASSRDTSHHQLWGIYSMMVDPVAETIEVAALRSGQLHFNILPFLEGCEPAKIGLYNIDFSVLGQVGVDIAITHPIPDPFFTGFDVCGILISNGHDYWSYGRMTAGEGDTRLLNADGYSRWWNPMEFSTEPGLFSYNDGIFGTPQSIGGFYTNINGYKYFADILGTHDTIAGLTYESRGVFSAGTTNTRHYQIALEGDLMFNYAVDACWEVPFQTPPSVPGSFPMNANRPEPVAVMVEEIENTLWNDGQYAGGDLVLHVTVFDWDYAYYNTVNVIPEGFYNEFQSNSPIEMDNWWAVFEIECTSLHPPPDEMNMLIECEDMMAFDPNWYSTSGYVCAYFMHTVQVADGPG